MSNTPRSLSQTPSALVPFTTRQLLSGGVLWLHPDWRGETGPESDTNGPSREQRRQSAFREQFAFAVEKTGCFAGLRFGRRERTMWAERYGGRGIGNNGGGARVGTLGDVQLKGLGANCLAGDSPDDSHSWGGLDARLAVDEAILSEAIGRVLPRGCARVLGMIHTGAPTAITHDGSRCLGVILVREATVRVGHYLPARAFKVRAAHASELVSERTRLRRVLKELRATLGGRHEDLWQCVGEFLSASADQLGCAWALRIAHGTLSPSNLCLDGRWVDLSMAGFVPGSRNHGSHFQERERPPEFAVELLDNYGKVHGIEVDPRPLIDHYARCFELSVSRHLATAFGLAAAEVPPLLDSEPWRRLACWCDRLLAKDADVDPTWPSPTGREPFTLLVEGLFLSHFGSPTGRSLVARAFEGLRAPIDDLIGCFDAVFDALAQAGASARERRLGALRRGFVALRRAHLRGCFYFRTVDEESGRLCQRGTLADLAAYVDESARLARWVFDDPSSDVTVLFESKHLRVSHSAQRAEWCVERPVDDGSATPRRGEWLASARDVARMVRKLPAAACSLRGFDARPYLERQMEMAALASVQPRVASRGHSRVDAWTGARREGCRSWDRPRP